MIVVLALVLVALIFVVQAVKIVPQQNAWVVERLGKYHATLTPGLQFVVPLIDRVAYKHSLKETAIPTGESVALTRDNTQLKIDAILYFQVTDPQRASYGAQNYQFAITQLAQTVLRSAIGKMELDKTFEKRAAINAEVVSELDKAAANWGVKVLRYEIKDLTPPDSILKAMQQQTTAEREKRARIAGSEGKRQEEINIADGEKQAAIAESEGAMTAQINRAKGEAEAIKAVAEASANAIERIAKAISAQGGEAAVQLKVAEKAVDAFAQLAKTNNTMIVPASMGEVSGLIGSAMALIAKGNAPAGHQSAVR